MRKETTEKKTTEERLAALERAVAGDPAMRARLLGYDPNCLSPAQFAEVWPNGFRGAISKPGPDPLTPREANVFAQHEPGIAEAEESMQVALSEYEEATAKWHEAVQESRRCAGEAGDKFDARGGVIVPPSSPLYTARAAEAAALEERTDAERALDKARLHHASLVTKRDLALHAARNEPGRLQQIKDKVLG